MAKFSLQFPASDIEALATRYAYQDDRAVLAGGAAARERGYFTREEFRTVCAWKTGRSKRRVRSNSAAAVEEATRRALAATDEAERMNALTSLRGVGVPTASTLLFAAEPMRHPILDRRALESPGRRPRGVYPVASGSPTSTRAAPSPPSTASRSARSTRRFGSTPTSARAALVGSGVAASTRPRAPGRCRRAPRSLRRWPPRTARSGARPSCARSRWSARSNACCARSATSRRS